MALRQMRVQKIIILSNTDCSVLEYILQYELKCKNHVSVFIGSPASILYSSCVSPEAVHFLFRLKDLGGIVYKIQTKEPSRIF